MHNVSIKVELLIANLEIFYNKCIYIMFFVCLCFSPIVGLVYLYCIILGNYHKAHVTVLIHNKNLRKIKTQPVTN